jgi:cobyric acid synthase
MGGRSRKHGRDDGCIDESGRVFGTYLHGLFENENMRSALLGHLYRKKKNPEFAELVERYVDVPAIRELVGAGTHDDLIAGA